MASHSNLGRVSAIVLRSMRQPLMTLLIVYSIAVLVMTFIPGIKVDGKTQYMSIFHAFYFMTYTATTTGFGEIPFEFSNAQRIWAILCLYISVIAWFYAIGTIIQLLQNPHLQQTINEERFARAVKRIHGDFFILCGFGDTGSLLARGISEANISCVIIERSEERIKALTLRDYKVLMPGVRANAGIPKYLIAGGVESPNCKAVICVTNNEETNLKISTVARLLNPSGMVITKSKQDIYEETLSTLGQQIHIVDPFTTFAHNLSAAVHNPMLYALSQWLVGSPSAPTLQNFISPPRGVWVICGYGKMGQEICAMLHSQNIPTAVIDPHHPSDKVKDCTNRYVIGRTTTKTLTQAGIQTAAGLVAGTDDDGHNLSILLNARMLNPNLFTIVRQNRHENEAAFNAADVDIIMQPSLVTARRILFMLTAPLLEPFFKYLTNKHSEDINLMPSVVSRLEQTVGHHKPHLITIDIDRKYSSATIDLLVRGEIVTLAEILRDMRNRNDRLQTVPLVIRSDKKVTILPPDSTTLKENDQILFCGQARAHHLLSSALDNEYALHYLRLGTHKPRGYLMRWLTNKATQRQQNATL